LTEISQINFEDEMMSFVEIENFYEERNITSALRDSYESLCLRIVMKVLCETRAF